MTDSANRAALGAARTDFGVLGFLASTLGVFIAAFITRSGMIDHPPIYDELYQFLPALSWYENQNFAILDGYYDRAARFTQLIALSFDIFGEKSTFAARLIPSIIPGALLVTVIFAWCYRVAGPVAALITAFFLLLWPNGIEVSQYIRFYAAQGILFVLGAIAVYSALAETMRLVWRLILLAIGAVLLFLALDLQMSTALGIGAILLWIALVYGPGWLRTYPKLWWVLGAGVLAVAGVLASGIFADTIQALWFTYNWEPWPAHDDRTFYHRDFRDNYPTFWPLFPVIAIIALRVNFVPASFCIILFTATFVLQSFGGLKNIRYLYPTMGFFFVLWGIVLQALLPSLWRYLRTQSDAAFGEVLPKTLVRATTVTVLIIAVGFLIFANAAFIRGAKLALGSDDNELLGKKRWHWGEAQAITEPWIADGALIVTTEELRTIQFLGDFDLGYNKPRYSELFFMIGPEARPFDIDQRTGRPLVGDMPDLQRVAACEPIGFVITDRPGLGGLRGLEDYLRAADVDLTRESAGGMSMLGWRHGPDSAFDVDCTQLPDFGASRAADRINSGKSVPQTVSSAATDR